jgi:hypothetical protein
VFYPLETKNVTPLRLWLVGNVNMEKVDKTMPLVYG